VFAFTSGTPQEVLAKAKSAAGGQDVRLNGGVHIVRAFLRAGLVNHLHLVVYPVILGGGKRFLDGIDLQNLGFRAAEAAASEGAMHLVYQKE
jgi:dihydrofolate reductase